MNKLSIAILASGNGSNAENLIHHFQEHPNIKVVLIGSNKANAGVHQRALKMEVPSVTFSKDLFNSPAVLQLLNAEKFDLMVLAGFLWKIPALILAAFPNRIINIHPALLPKYGGKGMYGTHIHQLVLANKEVVTGITIHLVNEIYDQGKVLFQVRCEVYENDTVDSLANRVHQLEYQYFPKIVEEYILSL